MFWPSVAVSFPGVPLSGSVSVAEYGVLPASRVPVIVKVTVPLGVPLWVAATVAVMTGWP